MDIQRVLSCPSSSAKSENPQFQGYQNFLDGLSSLTLPSEPSLETLASISQNPSYSSQSRGLLPPFPPMQPQPLPAPNISNISNFSGYGYPSSYAPPFEGVQRKISGHDIFPPSRNFRMDINSGIYAFRPQIPSDSGSSSSSSAPVDLPKFENYPQFSLERSVSMPVPFRNAPMHSFHQDLDLEEDGEKVTLPSFQTLTQNLQLSPHSRPISAEIPECLPTVSLPLVRPEKSETPVNFQEHEHLQVLEEQKEFLRQMKLKDGNVREKSSEPMDTSESDWMFQQPVSYQESFEGSLGQYENESDFHLHQMRVQRASSIPTGRICRHRGCTKTAQTGGFCRPHGGGSRCKHPGCTKCAQKGGYCTRHGGGVRCGVKDCPKGAQVGGFCVAHGGGRRCKYSGCNKAAQKGSYCVTHGGAWRCKVDGCEKLDAGRGLCIRHGGGRRCQEKDCHKLDKGGGYCVAHGRELTGKGSPSSSPQ